MSEYRGYLIGCGIVAAVSIGSAVLLYPVFAPTRPLDGQRRTCATNVRILAMIHQQYAVDHDDLFPCCERWMDEIEPLTKDRSWLHCVDLASLKSNQYGYSMNIALSAADTSKLASPSRTALLFDSVILDRNACSNLVGLPDPPRHSGNSIAFADGHVDRTDSLLKNTKY